MRSLQKNIVSIYALVLLFSFILAYSSIFDKSIDLGGDNISYYLLGKSVSEGKGYINIHHIEQEIHSHYPPGYSAFIACIHTLFPNSISAIKLCNGLFFYTSLLLLLVIFKRLTKSIHLSFVVCLVILFNFHLLSFSTIMMSEIPFLFFSLLALFLSFKVYSSNTKIKNWVLLSLIITVSICMYIRTIGVVLFLSVTLCYIQKKNLIRAVIFSAGCILAYLPWILRNKSIEGNSYIQQLLQKNPYNSELGLHDLHSFLKHIFANIERYITKEIPYSLFNTDNIVYKVSSTPILDWSKGFFIVMIILFGVYKNKHFKHLFFIYTLLFFGVLVLWPQVWYGTRFMIPILPFLIYYFISGIVAIITYLETLPILKPVKHFKRYSSLLLLCFWAFGYARVSIDNLNSKVSKPYPDSYNNYFLIADWVKDNTDKNSITCVRKETLFYFHSQKNVVTFKKTIDLEAQIKYLIQKNVDYVVVDQLGFSSTYRFLYPAIERYPNKFKIIKEINNPNTYLMAFKPNLGYWGEWKNNKRNGFGTYLWDDKQRYEGYWKNDVRHGQGTLYLSNGEKLTGIWTNGKLNGKVQKLSKNGEILEIVEYKNNKKIKTLEAKK